MVMETDADVIKRELTEINDFVKERFNPQEGKVVLLQDEIEKVKAGINGVIEAQRVATREAAMRQSEDGVRVVVPEGPYRGIDVLDLRLLGGMANSQRREASGPAWIERVREAHASVVATVTPEIVEMAFERIERTLKERFQPRQYKSFVAPVLQQWHRAAMDSTTAGYGDELVATLQAAELWMDVNLQTMVAPLIPTIPMPSNPFNMPHQLGDVYFYPGTENVATTSTALATGRTTLTAYELVGQVPYSFALEEDAVFASLSSEIRASLVRNVAEILDDIILNADTTTTNNINADGATIAATDAGKGHWLIGYDGLIHLPLVDSTSVAHDHAAAPSDDMFNELRAKLGKYGARPSQLAWIMDVNTYIRAQGISNYRTMDKLGPNATLLTGMLGAVEGIPVIVSEEMLLTASDGKVTDGTAGTVGRCLLVNRTQWLQGFRRELTVDVDRDTQKRQTVLTVSFRHALAERSGTRSTATHTGLMFDITGVVSS